jgi:hypothetical protein
MTQVLRRILSLALLVVIAFLGAACGTSRDAARRPWDEPVDGAGSVTDWISEGQPQLGSTSSPEELLARVAEVEAGTWEGGDVAVKLAGSNANGTLVGFARTTFEALDPLRGVDLRFDMRADSGAWLVVATDRRYHCEGATATVLCE